MGWTIGVLGFDSRRGLGIFLFTTPSRTSGAHPASCQLDYRASFPGGKAAGGMKLTTHLNLMPRSKNEWSYTSPPPIRRHGVVLSWGKQCGGEDLNTTCSYPIANTNTDSIITNHLNTGAETAETSNILNTGWISAKTRHTYSAIIDSFALSSLYGITS
jgi:hypothetical protein